jgi:molybdate transport system substrate-binding protein
MLHARRLSSIAALVLGLLAFPCVRSTAAQDVPIVAAASDLKFAVEEIAAAFRRQAARDVKLVFGSSGNFYTQIQKGAPFQLFMSADEQYALELAAKGFAIDEGALYAVGRIVIIAPRGSPLKVDAELAELRAALGDGRVRRFAIANPEHAPYGRRAEEALRHAGLWDAVRDKLVLGENVSQAAQFAVSGSAQGGMVAFSLMRSPELANTVSYALIPETWHQPLRQRMVLLKTAGATAREFFSFLQAPEARAVFRWHGFALPHEG